MTDFMNDDSGKSRQQKHVPRLRKRFFFTRHFEILLQQLQVTIHELLSSVRVHYVFQTETMNHDTICMT
jgi:hypothetical protein